jgi:molecular chaperone HscB
VDHFETMGLPRAFRLDEKALEEKHRELTRLLHPDRHAARGAAARRLALEKMIEVNDAYRVLKDPARRAAHLLQLSGIDLSESGAQGAGAHLPQDFLLEVMDLREDFDAARAKRDAGKVKALTTRIQDERARELASAEDAFARGELGAAAAAVAKMRYHDRFLGEVRAYEDELFEEQHGT